MQSGGPMLNQILDQLTRIEFEHQVRILYAVESGSRAWGFASLDSDYDVRFIYIHPLDWYLSVRDKRDVIECPISGALDVNGWDLRKTLGLFRKTNPPLLEWLGSPIVYTDRHGLAGRLRALLASEFSPRRCLRHYLHMAQGNYREYLKGDTVKLKKYLYVLRPILACTWIQRHGTMPPTEIQRLVADARLESALDTAIADLVARKQNGEELDEQPRIPILNEYIEAALLHFEALGDACPAPSVDENALDGLFREMLREVWV